MKTHIPLPVGACDCHMHVFDPAYPFAATATVKPRVLSTLPDYQQVQQALGLTRAVVVQSTAYGLDNRCLLDALRVLGDNARGVATLDASVDDDTLTQMHAAGVRGLRFMMLGDSPLVPWDAMEPLAARIAPLGWHINLQMDGAGFPQQLSRMARLGVPLVIDHNGKFLAPPSVTAPEFLALRSLMDTGRCWVKLSAPYETSRDGAPDYADVSRLASALALAYPERCLWASNWPHMGRETPPNEADLLSLLRRWVADEASVRRILVDNPKQLYGF